MRAIADCRFEDTPPCLRLAFGVSRRTLNVNSVVGWALPTGIAAAGTAAAGGQCPPYGDYGDCNPNLYSMEHCRFQFAICNLRSAIFIRSTQSNGNDHDSRTTHHAAAWA